MSKDEGYFKPGDFKDTSGGLNFYNQDGLQLSATKAALLANAKLQKDAKVVYGYLDSKRLWSWDHRFDETHQALLVAIKPIEKACEHPDDKITITITGTDLSSIKDYQSKCECGQYMRIKFEPVEK